MYIPHLPRVKSLAKQQAVSSMFVTYVCVYIHMYVERPMWRGPERPGEALREVKRGPERPEEAQREDRPRDAPERPRKAQRGPERLRVAQSGPERLGEA